MSIIFGHIDRSRKKRYKLKYIEDVFKQYHYDEYHSWENEECLLSCLKLNITNEDFFDKIPYVDKGSSLVISSDALLDNRNLLLSKLDIKNNIPVSDTRLILEAYKKWGYETPQYLTGVFTFAIWDYRKKELFCCRDHVGARPLYFLNTEKSFVFSTMMKPIILLDEYHKQLDEEYICEFLYTIGFRYSENIERTIYKNIKLLAPANCIVINKQGIRQWAYWEFKGNNNNNSLVKTEDCFFKFKELFTDIIQNSIRTSKDNVSILLSGGLDSGSIAAVSASELKKQNKILNSFTQIPSADYINFLSGKSFADESAMVLKYEEKYDNIRLHFMDCVGLNPYSVIDEHLKLLEQPYKTFQNTYWMDESIKLSMKKNSNVLLIGQKGNATISWGNLNKYLIYLKDEREFGELIKELLSFKKNNDLNTVFFLRLLVKLFFPDLVRFLKLHTKNYYKSVAYFMPINKAYFGRNELRNKNRRYFKYYNSSKKISSIEARKRMLSFEGLSVLGAFETKTSEKFGVIKRDPTKNKELIEFVLNLPEHYFYSEGIERYFIKEAMKNLVPEEILKSKKRGKQAADWAQRLKPNWEHVLAEIKSIGTHPLEKKYLDKKVIQRNIEEIKNFNFIRNDNINLIILIRTLIFSRFLRLFDSGELFE